MRWLFLLTLALAACDDGAGSVAPAISAQGDMRAALDQGAQDAMRPDATDDADDAMLDQGAEDATLVDASEGAVDMMPPMRPVLRASQANERDVEFDWIAAGQPTEARLTAVVEAGVPIISLRYANEDPFDEPALVAGLGGDFTRYPTSGGDYRSVAFREGMYDLYEAAIAARGTVYLHCASGNRVGASWALFHAERLGVDPEAALDIGRAAGLRGLESMVREVLGI